MQCVKRTIHVLWYSLPAMLLVLYCLDYHTRQGAHKGKPQLLIMHHYLFSLAVELALQTSIISITVCDEIPDKVYPGASILLYIAIVAYLQYLELNKLKWYRWLCFRILCNNYSFQRFS